ncbi:hypothetical protein KPL74_01935 [Bacillus sp. NP157]|nr:hypothetical protein KPL74_01935 [Bacillus sp. NP157]
MQNPLSIRIVELMMAVHDGRVDDIPSIAAGFEPVEFGTYLQFLLYDVAEKGEGVAEELMSALVAIPGVVTPESATMALLQACVSDNTPAILALTPYSEAMGWSDDAIAQLPPAAARTVQSVIDRSRLATLPMPASTAPARRL